MKRRLSEYLRTCRSSGLLSGSAPGTGAGAREPSMSATSDVVLTGRNMDWQEDMSSNSLDLLRRE